MNNSHLSDKIAEALRKAAVEIEEFQVQFSLGKAEAKDKYEELKKSFDKFVHEMKIKMQESREKSDDLLARFEALQVQLNLGIAEGKDAFNAQRLKILNALKELEEKIVTSQLAEPWVHLLKVEVEKFRIKLEILRLRYELGKMDATEEFEKRKSEFLDKISEMKSKFSDLINK